MVGAKERIAEVLRFKSNMDSGMFLPVQLAAATALQLDTDWYQQLNKIYSERRELVYQLLDCLHCVYDRAQVGMFVWAKIPARYKDGFELSDEILYSKNVFITPGGIFGSNGNGYVRISLCAKKEVLEEALARIAD
jgi:aspartate/methionine/tyrosine aminotransferase